MSEVAVCGGGGGGAGSAGWRSRRFAAGWPCETATVSDLVHLHGASFDLVVDVSTATPTIVHWGQPLGDAPNLAALDVVLGRPAVAGAVGSVAPISVVPLHAEGFVGRPGLAGRRGGGRDWAPRFATSAHRVDGEVLTVESRDDVAGLALTSEFAVADALTVRVTVTNVGDRRYSLDAATVSLPLPADADELLGFEGRWAREFHPVRTSWPHGAVVSEHQRGRTSHEHVPLLFAGVAGFGEWVGEVHGIHLAWSGNHTLLAERLADGRRYVQAGELLHPGEVVLEPGESYTTPEVVGVYSATGLTPATWGFHRTVRRSPTHLTTPRPVLLNTWEAVYFDHDLDTLRELADVAAAVGIERFVLDDGWFGSRRDDTSGLGDWWVSAAVYPDGLAPLIDHVTGLGMEFGIWVEPEMVNPDSDVFRALQKFRNTMTADDSLLIYYAGHGILDEQGRALLVRLKELRMALAKERNAPAYVIFSDKSLIDMAHTRPRNKAEFSKVFGVGQAKLDEFAETFLAEIAAGQ